MVRITWVDWAPWGNGAGYLAVGFESGAIFSEDGVPEEMAELVKECLPVDLVARGRFEIDGSAMEGWEAGSDDTGPKPPTPAG